MAISNPVSNDFFYLRSSIVLTFLIAAHLVWYSKIGAGHQFGETRSLKTIPI